MKSKGVKIIFEKKNHINKTIKGADSAFFIFGE